MARVCNIKGTIEVRSFLEKRISQLEEVAGKEDRWMERHYTTTSFTDAEYKKHSKKYSDVMQVMEELEELKEQLFNDELDFSIVYPAEKYQKTLKEADIYTVEYEGHYCKMAIVYKYPEKEKWVIYIPPMSVL